MPAFTEAVTLQPGIPATLVDAATGTGFARSQRFGVNTPSGGGPRTLDYQATVVPATALVANLEESLDGGTTWAVRVSAVNLFSTPAGQVLVLPGALYRWNITTFTGAGTATVLGTVS